MAKKSVAQVAEVVAQVTEEVVVNPIPNPIVTAIEEYCAVNSRIRELENQLFDLKRDRDEIGTKLQAVADAINVKHVDMSEVVSSVIDDLKFGIKKNNGSMIGEFIIGMCAFNGFVFKGESSGEEYDSEIEVRLNDLGFRGYGIVDRAPIRAQLIEYVNAKISDQNVQKMIADLLSEKKVVKETSAATDDEDNVILRDAIKLPGYEERAETLGVKIYVNAKGKKIAGYGGRAASSYLDKISFKDKDAGLRAIREVVEKWGRETGHIE